jgi:hypothetical protein
VGADAAVVDADREHRRWFVRVAILVGACALAASAFAAGLPMVGGLGVERLSVRFGSPPPDGKSTFAVRAPSLLRLTGTFDPSLFPPDFDPGVDPLAVHVSGVTVVEGPAFAAETTVHVRGTGGFVLRQVRPFEGRGALLLRIEPARGKFTLEARGVDLGLLLGNGPEGVPVAFRAGKIVHLATVDLTAVRPDLWIAP